MGVRVESNIQTIDLVSLCHKIDRLDDKRHSAKDFVINMNSPIMTYKVHMLPYCCHRPAGERKKVQSLVPHKRQTPVDFIWKEREDNMKGVGTSCKPARFGLAFHHPGYCSWLCIAPCCPHPTLFRASLAKERVGVGTSHFSFSLTSPRRNRAWISESLIIK